MTRSNPSRVFKIVTRAAWEEACRRGAFGGSDDDLKDGFVHLSAAHQLAGTLAKHFKGQTDLVLITLDADARGGDLFPHLYGALPTQAALDVRTLTSAADGVPIVPSDPKQC